MDTLSILTGALGAGLATWGIINLLEGYELAATKDEIAADYRSRMNEIDLLLQQLFEDKATGRITAAQYKALCGEYDAEANELAEALNSLDAEIAAQKGRAVNHIIQGAGFAAIAPTLHSMDTFTA